MGAITNSMASIIAVLALVGRRPVRRGKTNESGLKHPAYTTVIDSYGILWQSSGDGSCHCERSTCMHHHDILGFILTCLACCTHLNKSKHMVALSPKASSYEGKSYWTNMNAAVLELMADAANDQHKSKTLSTILPFLWSIRIPALHLSLSLGFWDAQTCTPPGFMDRPCQSKNIGRMHRIRLCYITSHTEWHRQRTLPMLIDYLLWMGSLLVGVSLEDIFASVNRSCPFVPVYSTAKPR